MSQPGEIVKMYETLKSKRINFDNTYQQIIDHIDPHHQDITITTQPGQRKNQRQFDGTALYASQVFADFYQSSVLNQGAKWWSVRHREEYINQKPDGADWLRL